MKALLRAVTTSCTICETEPGNDIHVCLIVEFFKKKKKTGKIVDKDNVVICNHGPCLVFSFVLRAKHLSMHACFLAVYSP